jgi:hypothetical protein|tara:strand:- start:71 stop:976 length:906 start_codon:yes stop_codon:yes gene_type:complete
MRRLYPLLSVLFFISCNPPHITPFNSEQFFGEIIEVDWSGRELVFVEESIDVEYNYLLSSFYSLNGLKEYKYEDLVNKKGKIIGLKLRNNDYWKDWIIQLEDGTYLKTIVKEKQIEEGHISHTYFVDDLDSVKTNMIGKSIWLNHITKGEITDDYYSVFVHTDLRKKNLLQIPFNRFDKVEIVDVIPFSITPFDIPFYLKIKSDKNKIGYIKYRDDVNRFPRIPYFVFNPLPNEWGDEIINMIKDGVISIGMTKEQVRISWGNPLKINLSSYGSSLMEQYVYLDNQYIYFENGVVSSFQSF